jgi:undecaprenyl-diphosphatase
LRASHRFTPGKRISSRPLTAAFLLGLAALPLVIWQDRGLANLARSAASPTMIRLLGGITWLGHGLLDIGLFLGLAVFAWWRADKPRTIRAVYGAGIVAASGVLDQVLKNVVCRARPTGMGAGPFFAQFPCFHQGYALASFPSGHATTAFAAAVLLSLWHPRASGVFWTLAALVGVSRIVLGAHFPSDVLAGALLGMGTAIVAHRILPPLQRASSVQGG